MIGAVILAAGESRRMGTQKLLLKIEGKPMIERVLDSFKGLANEIVAVLGHEPERLSPLLDRLGVKWVINENFQEGMASTFKRGVRELKHCDAVFLALGDQPFLDRGFLEEATNAWKDGAKVVSPIHKGKKGHPVLFDRSLLEEILRLGEGEYIRDVIHRHKDEHQLIETGDWAIKDVDTPEEFEAISTKI